jgi:hypothetical protein
MQSSYAGEFKFELSTRGLTEHMLVTEAMLLLLYTIVDKLKGG